MFRQGKALVPSFTAFAVTRLLSGHFSRSRRSRVHRGDGEGSRRDLATASASGSTSSSSSIAATPIIAVSRTPPKQAEEKADYPLIDVGTEPESGEPIRVRIGRFGAFLQMGEGGRAKPRRCRRTFRRRTLRSKRRRRSFAPRRKDPVCSEPIPRRGRTSTRFTGALAPTCSWEKRQRRDRRRSQNGPRSLAA